jgi:hypothetical protein
MPGNKIVNTLNEFKEQTAKLNMQELAYMVSVHSKAKEAAKVLPKSSSKRRGGFAEGDVLVHVCADRPLPVPDFAEYVNDFKELNQYKKYLPEILVDLDVKHKNYDLYEKVGLFYSEVFKKQIVNPAYPMGFKNTKSYCHFISCFQFMAALIVIGRVDYRNSNYVDIAGVLRSYIQGKTPLSDEKLIKLCDYIDNNTSPRYFDTQQDALETLLKYFLSDSVPAFTQANIPKSYILDWTILTQKQLKCTLCGDANENLLPIVESVINLTVPTSIDTTTTTTISDLLRMKAQPGKLGDHACRFCNDKDTMKDELETITRFPNVLILSVINGRFELHKDEKSGIYSQKRSKKTPTIKPDDYLYLAGGKVLKLTSIIYHSGSTTTTY